VIMCGKYLKNIGFVAIHLAIASLTSRCCNAQDADTFVDQFVLRCIQQSLEYSVICSFDSINVESSGEDTKTSTANRLFRIVKSASRNVKRIDIRSGQLSGFKIVGWGLQPATFREDGLPGTKSPNKILNFDVPGAPFSNTHAVTTGLNSYTDAFGNLDIVEFKQFANNEYVMWALSKERFAVKIHWHKVGEIYVPVELNWYWGPEGLSKLDKKGREEGIYKKWRLSQTTKTVWKDTRIHGPIPILISFATVVDQQNFAEAELRFLDWTFDDDLDIKLLEKEHFNRQGVLETVDFERWSKRFETWNVNQAMRD
jgi:hypothetical protein